MLKFSRNKLVSVYRKAPGTLVAHGVLEDDIYGLELDVSLSLPDLEILSVEGRWVRAENSECGRALPFLQEALGLRVEEGFARKIRKGVGRRACRHFADILVECCHAAREALALMKPESLEKEGSAITPSKDEPHVFPREVDATGGFVIDLHVHTSPASPCSSVTVDELIQEAKRIGLSGICLTDHNHVWEQAQVENLRKRHNFLVLAGTEITTDQGDVLVFGLQRGTDEIIPLEKLREEVLRAGGFMIAAHPFRGFLTFGVRQLGLTPEKAADRPLFKFVDAVEVLNSRVSDEENAFAAKVAAALRLHTTGGSDAHTTSELGLYGTRFSRPISDESDLIAALKSGDYQPVAFRRQGMKGNSAYGS